MPTVLPLIIPAGIIGGNTVVPCAGIIRGRELLEVLDTFSEILGVRELLEVIRYVLNFKTLLEF